MFTEEAIKTALSANKCNITQSIDWIETYVYGENRNLMRKKKKLNITV